MIYGEYAVRITFHTLGKVKLTNVRQSIVGKPCKVKYAMDCFVVKAWAYGQQMQLFIETPVSKWDGWEEDHTSESLNQFQHSEQLFRGYPQSRPQRAQ